MFSHRRFISYCWVAALISGSAADFYRPLRAAGPPLDWKLGEAFQLSVQVYSRMGEGYKRSTSADEAKPIASYTMYAVPQPVLPNEECGCWKLQFLPISKVPEFKDSYRIWIDKSTGHTRKGSRLTRSEVIELPPADFAVIILNAPAGYPLEFIPDIASATFPTARAGVTLEVTSRSLEGGSERKAIVRRNGKAEIEIRQRWLAGAKWWNEYERFYRGQRELTARLFIPKEPPPVQTPQQPPDPYGLRADPRLTAPISTHLYHRPLQELLDLISQKTGVELKMDADLSTSIPFIEDNSMQDLPAFQAMENLARNHVLEGRWEKVDRGYRLLGAGPRHTMHSLAGGTPLRPVDRTFSWRYIMGLGPAFIVGIAILYYRYRLAHKSANSAKDQRQNPPLI